MAFGLSVSSDARNLLYSAYRAQTVRADAGGELPPVDTRSPQAPAGEHSARFVGGQSAKCPASGEQHKRLMALALVFHLR